MAEIKKLDVGRLAVALHDQADPECGPLGECRWRDWFWFKAAGLIEQLGKAVWTVA